MKIAEVKFGRTYCPRPYESERFDLTAAIDEDAGDTAEVAVANLRGRIQAMFDGAYGPADASPGNNRNHNQTSTHKQKVPSFSLYPPLNLERMLKPLSAGNPSSP